MRLFYLFIGLSLSICSFSQTYGTFTDSRDGSVYKTVQIGSQVWMAENLHIRVGQDGSIMPELITNKEWRRSGGKNGSTCGWCSYKNDAENGSKYGCLYKWVAVNSCELCPDGWRIPTYDDIIELQNYLGGEAIAGAKMKSTSDWKRSKKNTNSSGFSALPSGFRLYSGGFQGLNKNTKFWTRTRNTQIHAVYMFRLSDDSNGLRISPWRPDGANPVRCILD